MPSIYARQVPAMHVITCRYLAGVCQVSPDPRRVSTFSYTKVVDTWRNYADTWLGVHTWRGVDTWPVTPLYVTFQGQTFF